MTNFRTKLTKEVLDLINTAIVKKEIRKPPPRKKTQVTLKPTCLEVNIEYPTDVRLKTKVYKKFVKIATETRDSSKEITIRGKHALKNQLNSFNKK